MVVPTNMCWWVHFGRKLLFEIIKYPNVIGFICRFYSIIQLVCRKINLHPTWVNTSHVILTTSLIKLTSDIAIGSNMDLPQILQLLPRMIFLPPNMCCMVGSESFLYKVPFKESVCQITAAEEVSRRGCYGIQLLMVYTTRISSWCCNHETVLWSWSCWPMRCVFEKQAGRPAGRQAGRVNIADLATVADRIVAV